MKSSMELVGYLLVILLGISLAILPYCLVGSLAVSAIKTFSDSCGKSYTIEKLPLISGNWFCEGEK